MSSFSSRTLVLSLLVFALATSLAWAQAGTSTIRGTVADQQDRMVSGATVTITHDATKATRTQQTGPTGAYSFDLIQPGSYTLTIEADGFRRQVFTAVHAQVGQATDLAAALEVGTVAEVIEVRAASAAVTVNTTDATLGNNFVSSQILSLPVEALNIQSLLTLQPGVTLQGYVAGARSDQSNLTLDGVDINEAQSNALDAPVLRLNASAIEEFRVQTVNANASQGRSSGAQVEVVTKSGTNRIRGDVFHLHRNTIFTANTFFNNRALNPDTGIHEPISRPKLIRNTFGGGVGGPLVRDKLFFFYSYEGRRDASESAPTARVIPLPSMGQGMLRYIGTDGNVHTLTTVQLNDVLDRACTLVAACTDPITINPAALAALADAASRYTANDFTVGDSNSAQLVNTAGFRFNSPFRVGQNSHVARFDFNANPQHTFFVRLNAIHDLVGQGSYFPDTPDRNTWNHPVGGVVAHTWSIRHNLVNTFRYGLTRDAFSFKGDSLENAISFRFVFEPTAVAAGVSGRDLSRVTPVHNITNDMSWVKGNHTFQFGTNMRFISNRRIGLGGAFDSAVTNPTLYDQSGAVVTNALTGYLAANGMVPMSSPSSGRNAFTALIGRLSQYQKRFTFELDGSLQPVGTPTERDFRVREYDFYFQDSWRMLRNLTLTYGLRYSLSEPVWEARGFEVKPSIPLSQVFETRALSALTGVVDNPIITMDLSGKANGRSPLYRKDTNNFQPRVAIAWSPSFENTPLLSKLFGREGESVVRTGFALTNDYYGQALAVNFDLINQLGFVQSQVITANTYNITSRPAPLFTGFSQDIRSLPTVTGASFPNPSQVNPTELIYPVLQAADGARRIEASLDEALVAPLNYMWNLTFERQLPRQLIFQTSYIGRLGRKLLAQRDPMQPANVVDPISGMDWYTAATLLEIERQKGTPLSQIQPIPYFENVLANMPLIFGNATVTQEVYDWMCCDNDWTFMQHVADRLTGEDIFFHPQYAALAGWGTVAHSNYHGMTVSLRQRLGWLIYDFNYTFSHSLDDASGLQTAGNFGGAPIGGIGQGSAFLLNSFQQRRHYASSSFDIRHQINLNSSYQLPFGRGQFFGGNAGNTANALIGGWQLSSIFRWNTGLPISAPFDFGRWSTNWNISSAGTQITPFAPCPTKGDATTAPKLFGCDPDAAYLSFRESYPGEVGQRNSIRLPGYVALDLGLSKSIDMPYNESHSLQVRWDVFNVTNTQRLTGAADFFTETSHILFGDEAPPTWSNFTGIQGSPRVMQIGLRYSF